MYRGTFALVEQRGRRGHEGFGTGEYWVNELLLEPQSTVAVDQTAGPVRINVSNRIVMRGELTHTPDPVGFLLAYFGQEFAVLERPFNGVFVAPNAWIALGGTGFQTFVGQFYAQTLEVRPDVTVVCSGGFGP